MLGPIRVITQPGAVDESCCAAELGGRVKSTLATDFVALSQAAFIDLGSGTST
jgi:hypothetical protein